jgi:hypothetical protein
VGPLVPPSGNGQLADFERLSAVAYKVAPDVVDEAIGKGALSFFTNMDTLMASALGWKAPDDEIAPLAPMAGGDESVARVVLGVLRNMATRHGLGGTTRRLIESVRPEVLAGLVQNAAAHCTDDDFDLSGLCAIAGVLACSQVAGLLGVAVEARLEGDPVMWRLATNVLGQSFPGQFNFPALTDDEVRTLAQLVKP